MSDKKLKVLFVCSYNIARSRTAEKLLTGSSGYEVKSAGFIMDERSGQFITQELVDWADVIILMDEREDRHITRLFQGFKPDNTIVVILGIPNIYPFNDPVLIWLLKEKLSLLGFQVNPAPA